MHSRLNYFPCPDFQNRYISPEKLFFFLQTNLSDSVSVIGTSSLGEPIYKFSAGNGRIRVLAWSQMHGNESNSTHAFLDLLESLKHQKSLSEELFSKISLDFIIMLNPDGSRLWKRRNYLDIDMNRDFVKESSPEMSVFKHFLESGSYDYALNLHEQRTIFSTDGIHPATLSFLAPSENTEREITANRKKSMAVIAKINKVLNRHIPNHIGRYSDEFYPRSTGDNLMKNGIPNILFEGGHFPDDYYRKETRKYYTIALYGALKAIGELAGSDENWKDYFDIPENNETHFDVIYRNVKLNTVFECVVDVAVQYKEVYEDEAEDISFVPIVAEVGDLSHKKGWKEIDCTNRFFKSESLYPKLDSPQNFEII